MPQQLSPPSHTAHIDSFSATRLVRDLIIDVWTRFYPEQFNALRLPAKNSHRHRRPASGTKCPAFSAEFSDVFV
ncbi:hypothetical protein EON65_46955 [archaeon]|nr:MAG: hypothetical protein EON65_46955 [archaeon]